MDLKLVKRVCFRKVFKNRIMSAVEENCKFERRDAGIRGA